MLESVKWAEFRLEDIFEWQLGIAEINPLHLDDLYDKNSEKHPFYGQATKDNGIISFNRLIPEVLNNPNAKPTLLIHSNNQNIVYVETPFYLKDGHGATSVLQSPWLSRRNALYLAATIAKSISQKFSYQTKATKIALKNTVIPVPVKNGQLDLDFMENFTAELEAQRTAELEAYLSASGLKDTALTPEEVKALEQLERRQWGEFNLKNLFGTATRGKRLKSADRISGSLPFVTAGEADTGISAFIGNDVERFKANTITIDMFGSAKYRNYEYGGDDHIAVVHTDKLHPMAVLFITSAIHKSSYNGQFNYGRNFYAKDADTLNILLPEKQGSPDYAYMQTLLSAVQKLVIKDVVQYADKKIAATRSVIRQNNQAKYQADEAV